MAFNETTLNFFFFFFVNNFIKIILVICSTAKNWTEIEKLKMRTWKLNTEYFKTVKVHNKRSYCTVMATWKRTIKKENRLSSPAEKKGEKKKTQKKTTGELSLFVTENIVFLFPVLILDPHKNLQAWAHQGILSWALLHQELLWRNTAHHKTLYLTYLQKTKNWCRVTQW